MSYSKYKRMLIVGGIISLTGFLIFAYAFKLTFYPSSSDYININGVPAHSGDPGFKSSAEGLLLFGIVVILSGLLTAIIPIVKPNWAAFIGSIIANSNQYSQNSYNIKEMEPDKHHHTKNNQRIEINNQETDNYDNVESLLESLPSPNDMNEPSSESTLSGYSDSYSETSDSHSESSDTYSESFDSSSQSVESNKTCPLCGAMIKPNDKICNNCGKRL